MGDPAAIKELTTLLVDLLRVRLASREDDDLLETHQIQPLAPTAMDDDSNVRLGLYLYRVSSDSGHGSERPEIEDGHKIRPPLALECHYLLTAFPDANAENEATGVLDQHEVLGAAMQALYDNNVIDTENLPASIGDGPIEITYDGGDEAAMLDLWSAFPEVAPQPSANYRVGPVLIDSTQKTAFERVSDRAVHLSKGSDRDEDG